MIPETLMVWALLVLSVAVLAWFMRSFPVSVVSSFGCFILGMKYYQDVEPDLFVLAMTIMLAFALPMAVYGRTKKRGH